MLIAPKLANDTNFKYGRCAPRDSPDMNAEKLWKGVWLGSRDPVNFWVLNANSSKMAKDMNFKFGMHDPSDCPDMTPENFFLKSGHFQGHVRH